MVQRVVMLREDRFQLKIWKKNIRVTLLQYWRRSHEDQFSRSQQASDIYSSIMPVGFRVTLRLLVLFSAARTENNTEITLFSDSNPNPTPYKTRREYSD